MTFLSESWAEMFKFIKKKIMTVIEDIKFLKELDSAETNMDTISQMSIEELIKFEETVFNKENCICVNGHVQINK